MSGKCGRKKLCPISLGIAVGLTAGLGYLLWVLWTMYYGPSSMMVEYHIPVPNLHDGSLHALWIFVKGFLFGLFIALFYDLISCCCRMKCCKKCECGCACCSGEKPLVK